MGVEEHRPPIFVPNENLGLILGQGEFPAYIGVNARVYEMMNKLAAYESPGAVSRKNARGPGPREKNSTTWFYNRIAPMMRLAIC